MQSIFIIYICTKKEIISHHTANTPETALSFHTSSYVSKEFSVIQRLTKDRSITSKTYTIPYFLGSAIIRQLKCIVSTTLMNPFDLCKYSIPWN